MRLDTLLLHVHLRDIGLQVTQMNVDSITCSIQCLPLMYPRVNLDAWPGQEMAMTLRDVHCARVKFLGVFE